MNSTMINGSKTKDGNIRRFVTADEFEDYRDRGWERDDKMKAIPDKVVDQLIPVRMSEEAYQRFQREHQGGRQTDLQVQNIQKKQRSRDNEGEAGETSIKLGRTGSKEEVEEIERKAMERKKRGSPVTVPMG